MSLPPVKSMNIHRRKKETKQWNLKDI
jgi:hypothetical protein